MADTEKRFDDAMTDFSKRRKCEQGMYRARQPKTSAEVMAAVLKRRDVARVLTNEQYNDIIKKVVGEPLCNYMQATQIKRSRLEIIVVSSTILQEISFYKNSLLKQLKKDIPDEAIQDIRFRIGAI